MRAQTCGGSREKALGVSWALFVVVTVARCVWLLVRCLRSAVCNASACRVRCVGAPNRGIRSSVAEHAMSAL